MKHPTSFLTLFVILALAVPTVSAQGHQHDAPRTEQHDGRNGHMNAMMQLHEYIMADAELHQALMADEAVAEGMRTMMSHMMDRSNPDQNMDAMHSRMMNASPAERKQMITSMHARMQEHMAAMNADEHRAMMQQMMTWHERIMQVPAMRARLESDPELRRLMEAAMEGHEMMHDETGMENQNMSHGGMNHQGMDHEGMDHSRQEHAATMSAAEKAAAEAASRTADRFYQAIETGDRTAVEALLLPDAQVLEGGGVETRSEYLGGHFGSDGAFLAAVQRTPLTRRTHVSGDVAWVTSVSRLAGTYRDRQIDLQSAELLVLRREADAPDGWRIAAVHWSSGTTH